MTAEHAELAAGWYGLARVQTRQGDKAGAKQSLEQAIAHAQTPAQKKQLQARLDRFNQGQAFD